jgi:hypothetical protein
MYAHARTYPLSSHSLRRSPGTAPRIHFVTRPSRRSFFSPHATQQVKRVGVGVETARAVLAVANAVLWAWLLLLM